jgi:hypothetical protein
MEKNPYAAPRAAVDDVVPEKRSRPILVWVITIFMGLGVVGTTVTSIAALSGTPIGGPDVAAQLAFFHPLDHLTSLVSALLAAVSAVELFRLKRRALPFFVGSLAVTAVVVCGSLALRPAYRAILENGGGWMIAVGWTINFAILAYVWRLHAKGVLQ